MRQMIMRLSKIIKIMNNQNQTKSKKSALIAFIAILVAASAYFLIPKKNPQAQPPQGLAQMEVKPIDLPVIKVEKKLITPFVEIPGRVNAQKIAQIRPQVDGIVKEVKFVEGSFVNKGIQLYQIDPVIYQAAVNAAESSAKTLKDKKERYEVLVINDAVSKQELSDAGAEYAKAVSELSKAKKNLEFTKVLAPISGYIGKTNVTEGALVTANQTQVMTTITQLDPIYVDLEQSTKDVAAMIDEDGIEVKVSTEDKNYEKVGTLKFREMFADESTDSVRLRAVFSNEDRKLLPGMFVTARVSLPSFEAITVPQRVTNRAPNGNLVVFVVGEDGSVASRPIKADRVLGDSWIVEGGISEGEKIVYEGFQKIREGIKINPIDPQAPNAAPKAEVKNESRAEKKDPQESKNLGAEK
jgi:membrane fusion protein (multidrug efflux system)